MALIPLEVAQQRARDLKSGRVIPPNVKRARDRATSGAKSSPTTATKDISKQSQGLLFTPLNPTVADTTTDDKSLINKFLSIVGFPFFNPISNLFGSSTNTQSVTTAGSNGGNFIESLFGGIGSGFGKLFGNFASETGKGFGTGLEEIGLGAGKGFGSIGREVGTGFGTGFEKIGAGFGSGVGAIGSGVGTAFEQTLGGIGRGAGTGLAEIGSGVGSGFSDIGGGIGSGIKQLSTPLLLLGGGILLFNLIRR